MDQIAYDATVIEDFAFGLYKRAASIIYTYTVGLGLVGLVGGVIAGHAFNTELVGAAVGAFGGGVLFGVIGLSLGRERAFALKLQAQVALCQVRIEANTRRG